MSLESDGCAAKEFCICKAAGASDGRHACPVCQCNVHAICGEVCEDAGLKNHKTCFPCFAGHHQGTFESPDNFQPHISVIEATGGKEVHVPGAMAIITQQVMDD